MSSGDVREPQSNDIREPQSKDDRQQVVFGVVLATTVAQIGCVTVFIILGALALGLVLDSQLGTKPLFTLLLVLASIPLSLYILVRIALSTAAQVASPPPKAFDDNRPTKNED